MEIVAPFLGEIKTKYLAKLSAFISTSISLYLHVFTCEGCFFSKRTVPELTDTVLPLLTLSIKKLLAYLQTPILDIELVFDGF